MTSGKKDEKLKLNPNPNPRVLTNETYATESAYMSTTTMKLEAAKAAMKPPLRSMFAPCFGVIYVRVSLSALILKSNFFYRCYPCHSTG